jgi:hypothetical protein
LATDHVGGDGFVELLPRLGGSAVMSAGRTQSCCGSSERATWVRRGVEAIEWAAPGAILAVLPKCPACVAMYVALATGVGVSVSAATYLRTGTMVVCAASLLFLAARAVRRRFA